MIPLCCVFWCCINKYVACVELRFFCYDVCFVYLAFVRCVVLMTTALTPEAFATAYLHTLRYSTCDVSGVFLGKDVEGHVFVSDAVPLFHSTLLTGSSPMLQVALLQCAAVAKTRGLNIVGMYFANERANDKSVPANVRAALANVQGRTPVLCVAQWTGGNPFDVVVSTKVGGGELRVVPLQFQRWSKDTCTPDEAKIDDVTTLVREAVVQLKHHQLVDFDHHLDDPGRDHFNPKLWGTA